MRKIQILFLILISFAVISCESTKEIPQKELETEVPEVQEENSEVIPEESEVAEQIVEEYIEEDDVEFIDEEIPTDEEYLRSIEDITTEEEVTQEEFTDDKAAILRIIEELSSVMEEVDTNSWLDYLDPDSKKYYSNPANLRKAQRKLPNRLIQLKTIKDYFINVFIPSRKQSQVDEIRYISKTEVKAVEVKDDEGIVVYYYFKKINDKWYINLPVLE